MYLKMEKGAFEEMMLMYMRAIILKDISPDNPIFGEFMDLVGQKNFKIFFARLRQQVDVPSRMNINRIRDKFDKGAKSMGLMI